MTIPPARPTTFVWTEHSKEKMRYYALSESRVKRVVRFPKRREQGIAPGTIAAMQPITKKGKTTQEIWTMYSEDNAANRIKIITAWRYPGESPIREGVPIPEDLHDELVGTLSQLI